MGTKVAKRAQMRANVRANGGKLCKRRVYLAHFEGPVCRFVRSL